MVAALVVVLLLAAGGVTWLVVGGGGRFARLFDRGQRGENDFRPYSPGPDDRVFVSFPGQPQWVDNPVDIIDVGGRVKGQSTLRMFQYEAPEAKELYALLSHTLHPYDDETYNEFENARQQVQRLGGLLRGGEWTSLTDGYTKGFPSCRAHVNVPARGVEYEICGIFAGNRVYVLTVGGPEFKSDHPRVREFINSFQFPDAPPRGDDPPPNPT